MATDSDVSSELIEATMEPTAIDAAASLTEVGFDALLDDGLFRDIPLFSTLVSLARVGINMRDRIFLKKVFRFLTEFRDVSETDRRQFRADLLRSPQRRKALGENIMLLLERIDDFDKAKLVGRSFLALLLKEISEPDFNRLCRAIDRVALTADIRSLANWKGDVEKLSQEIGLSLSAAGLLELNSETVYVDGSRDYRMTKIGTLAATLLVASIPPP